MRGSGVLCVSCGLEMHAHTHAMLLFRLYADDEISRILADTPMT